MLDWLPSRMQLSFTRTELTPPSFTAASTRCLWYVLLLYLSLSLSLSLSHRLVLWSHYHPLQPARIRIELASPNDARRICEPGQRTNAIAVSFYPKVELADDMELKTEIIFLIDRSGSMAGISNVVRSVFRSLTLTH